jgi:Cu(I)/Ag(I) efflux system membrane fusion protein
LPYAGARAFTGRVSYVYPYLEPVTRTLKVRLEFPNPDLQLKPAMYVDVTLAIEAPPAVVIPASAVLDSGERQVVFVETAANHFEPRAVTLGLRSAEKVEVLAGVREGEHVVVRANFLLDSESRLRGALSGMGGGHDHAGERP